MSLSRDDAQPCASGTGEPLCDLATYQCGCAGSPKRLPSRTCHNDLVRRALTALFLAGALSCAAKPRPAAPQADATRPARSPVVDDGVEKPVRSQGVARPSVPTAPMAPVHVVPPPDPHPLLQLLRNRLVAWAPEAQSTMSRVELVGTGHADTGRTLRYLQSRLRRDLVVPVLARSGDPVVVEVRTALDRIPLFVTEADVLSNLILGPHVPSACEPCLSSGECPTRCTVERSRISFAAAAAPALGEGLSFGGIPTAGDDGLVYGQGLTLEQHLDDAVARGLPRARVVAVAGRLLADAALRSRTIEGPTAPTRPTQRDAGALTPLANAVARWRASTTLRNASLGDLDVDAPRGSDERVIEAFHRELRRFTSRLFLAAESPAERKYGLALASELRARDTQNDAASTTSFTEEDEVTMPEDLCTGRNPLRVRSCEHRTEGVDVLHYFSERFAPLVEGTAQPSPLDEVTVALALEHFTLAGIPSHRLDRWAIEWLTDAATPPTPPR